MLSKGLHAIIRNGWFAQSQRGITYRDPGGGAVSRHSRRLVLQVLLCSTLDSRRLVVGIYLVGSGRGQLARATTSWSTS